MLIGRSFTEVYCLKVRLLRPQTPRSAPRESQKPFICRNFITNNRGGDGATSVELGDRFLHPQQTRRGNLFVHTRIVKPSAWQSALHLWVRKKSRMPFMPRSVRPYLCVLPPWWRDAK